MVVGVLSLAPCYVGKIQAQVRRDDQSRYHNLKPPSSLGSGWNEIHCPPANVKRAPSSVKRLES